ncbi:MAG: KEOPS complex kinase/ATPase Bud32 [Nanoarchaeota archaeon]
MKAIAQGAEAVIYADAKSKEVRKVRIRKNYRLPQIDIKLRKERTKKEASILHKLQRAGINVPQLTKISEFDLEMEFLDGEKLRDYLEKTKDLEVCRKVGEQVAKMHSENIVHGDLTTSNMILKSRTVFLIDFGLGDFSQRIEDKAVDLHIFKECLKSKHFGIWENAWKEFAEGYKNQEVINRLKIVEARGRYKHAS